MANVLRDTSNLEPLLKVESNRIAQTKLESVKKLGRFWV